MSGVDLISWFADEPYVTFDRRASQRDRMNPSTATGRLIGSFSEALNRLSQADPAPCAIVKEDGDLFVCSPGWPGVVWVCSSDGQITDRQIECFDLVIAVLGQMGAAYDLAVPLPAV